MIGTTVDIQLRTKRQAQSQGLDAMIIIRMIWLHVVRISRTWSCSNQSTTPGLSVHGAAGVGSAFVGTSSLLPQAGLSGRWPWFCYLLGCNMRESQLASCWDRNWGGPRSMYVRLWASSCSVSPPGGDNLSIGLLICFIVLWPGQSFQLAECTPPYLQQTGVASAAAGLSVLRCTSNTPRW